MTVLHAVPEPTPSLRETSVEVALLDAALLDRVEFVREVVKERGGSTGLGDDDLRWLESRTGVPFNHLRSIRHVRNSVAHRGERTQRDLELAITRINTVISGLGHQVAVARSEASTPHTTFVRSSSVGSKEPVPPGAADHRQTDSHPGPRSVARAESVAGGRLDGGAPATSNGSSSSSAAFRPTVPVPSTAVAEPEVPQAELSVRIEAALLWTVRQIKHLTMNTFASAMVILVFYASLALWLRVPVSGDARQVSALFAVVFGIGNSVLPFVRWSKRVRVGKLVRHSAAIQLVGAFLSATVIDEPDQALLALIFWAICSSNATRLVWGR